MRTDYSPFHVGQVRVTTAEEGCFLAYGEYLPGGLWIYRGQVHSDSEVNYDAGRGDTGHLVVTYWWAMSRKLTREAPKPRARKSTTESPTPSLPAGYARRNNPEPITSKIQLDRPSSMPTGQGWTVRKNT